MAKKKDFHIEMYRAFHSVGFYAALLFGVIVAVYQAVIHFIGLQAYSGTGYTGITVWTNLLFNDAIVSMANFLLRFAAPFLVCLPHGLSYWQDRVQGYGKNILTRMDKRSYLAGKWMAAVGSGVIVLLQPYVLNFLLTGLFLPIRNADLMNMNQGLHPSLGMVRLYYKNTFLYAAFYLLLFALFATACVTVCLAVSTLAEFWFTSLLTPFLMCILLLNVGNITGHHEIAPFYFLESNQPVELEPLIVIGALILTIAGASSVYFIKGTQSDVF